MYIYINRAYIHIKSEKIFRDIKPCVCAQRTDSGKYEQIVDRNPALLYNEREKSYCNTREDVFF